MELDSVFYGNKLSLNNAMSLNVVVPSTKQKEKSQTNKESFAKASKSSNKDAYKMQL